MKTEIRYQCYLLCFVLCSIMKYGQKGWPVGKWMSVVVACFQPSFLCYKWVMNSLTADTNRAEMPSRLRVVMMQTYMTQIIWTQQKQIARLQWTVVLVASPVLGKPEGRLTENGFISLSDLDFYFIFVFSQNTNLRFSNMHQCISLWIAIMTLRFLLDTFLSQAKFSAWHSNTQMGPWSTVFRQFLIDQWCFYFTFTKKKNNNKKILSVNDLIDDELIWWNGLAGTHVFM